MPYDPVTGLPTSGNTLPAGIFDTLLPYLQYGPDYAKSIYDTQTNAAVNLAQIAQGGQNAQTAAAATIGAAGINAAGGIQQQLIQTLGQLKGLKAQIAANQVLAEGGDANAMARLNTQNQQAAYLANQAAKLTVMGLQEKAAEFNQTQRLNVAGLASSTGFREGLQAQLYA